MGLHEQIELELTTEELAMFNETLSPATIQAVGLGGTTGIGHHDSYCLEVFGHKVDQPGSKIVASHLNVGATTRMVSLEKNNVAP